MFFSHSPFLTQKCCEFSVNPSCQADWLLVLLEHLIKSSKAASLPSTTRICVYLLLDQTVDIRASSFLYSQHLGQHSPGRRL